MSDSSKNLSLNSTKSATLSKEGDSTLEAGAPSVLSVEQLNLNIKKLIEGELPLVWVKGEISNFKKHSSGHFYFSLKDSRSQISAVMFRGHNMRLRFLPQDGAEVLVRGRVSVYEPRGNYQIVCDMMEPVGAGALQRSFEQLKIKLKTEGLFESSRKRPLPSFPQHIAVVTSPTGAAIRDILNILKRRAPGIRVTVVPTIVQGEAAAPQIIKALEMTQQLKDVDVIICGRGGGSTEDLWAFNNEQLARAISSSRVPVVSAVGHEIDFTICDFVADLRAPTPSAAAELVARSTTELSERVLALGRLLQISLKKHLQSLQQRLHLSQKRLLDPRKRLQDLRLRNDDLMSRLDFAIDRLLEKRKMKIMNLSSRLVHPKAVLEKNRQQLQILMQRLDRRVQFGLDSKKHKATRLIQLLDSLSPLKVVDRGYALVTHDKKVLKDTDDIKVGASLEIRLAKGELVAVVTEKKER